MRHGLGRWVCLREHAPPVFRRSDVFFRLQRVSFQQFDSIHVFLQRQSFRGRIPDCCAVFSRDATLCISGSSGIGRPGHSVSRVVPIPQSTLQRFSYQNKRSPKEWMIVPGFPDIFTSDLESLEPAFACLNLFKEALNEHHRCIGLNGPKAHED
jgi:hypothetical protein